MRAFTVTNGFAFSLTLGKLFHETKKTLTVTSGVDIYSAVVDDHNKFQILDDCF